MSLPGDAKAGDTLKVSGQPADRLLTDADITAGKVGYEDRPADGVTLTVTATIVDAAGNVSLPAATAPPWATPPRPARRPWSSPKT